MKTCFMTVGNTAVVNFIVILICIGLRPIIKKVIKYTSTEILKKNNYSRLVQQVDKFIWNFNCIPRILCLIVVEMYVIVEEEVAIVEEVDVIVEEEVVTVEKMDVKAEDMEGTVEDMEVTAEDTGVIVKKFEIMPYTVTAHILFLMTVMHMEQI